LKHALIALLLLTAPAYGSVSVKRATSKAINVTVVDEPLSTIIKAMTPHLARRVQLLVSADPHITYSVRQIAPDAALREIVEAAGATLTIKGNQYWIQDAPEQTVTLDVKDQDIRLILKEMKQQCRIKNLVIDPGVSGSGTFLFDKLPCRAAFGIVLRTLGLAYVDYGNSVMSVERKK
jgi:type II secretory pathway component GspD/PulD (secretin)